MTKTKKEKIAIIPEKGHCSRYQCSDCTYLNTNDRNKYGEFYCPVMHKYYAADSCTCSSFVAK